MISPLSTTAIILRPFGVVQPQQASAREPDAPAPENRGAERPEETASRGQPRSASPDGLTAEERRIVAQLARIDREVRAHEQAHLAAAGGLARGVSFSFVTGPDGKQYAVGGEVSLDTSPEPGNPEATIRKAQQIRTAANAPANPSGQDRQVAAQATQMEAAALQELAQQQRRQLEERNRALQAQAFQPEDSSPVGTLLSLLA